MNENHHKITLNWIVKSALQQGLSWWVLYINFFQGSNASRTRL